MTIDRADYQMLYDLYRIYIEALTIRNEKYDGQKPKLTDEELQVDAMYLAKKAVVFFNEQKDKGFN